MRSFRVNISGNKYLVEVAGIEQSPIQVRVNGKAYDIEVEWQGAQAEATVTPEIVPSYPVSEPVLPATKRPLLPPRPRLTDSERQAAAVMEAPMPGTIVEVKVRAGDVVERGDEICLLEAMKMRNSIKAARSGQIDEVLVTAGSKVAYGDLLVRFAADTEATP